MKVPLQYLDRLIRAEKIAAVAIKEGFIPPANLLKSADPLSKGNLHLAMCDLAHQSMHSGYLDHYVKAGYEADKLKLEVEDRELLQAVIVLTAIPNPLFSGARKSKRPTKQRAAELLGLIASNHYADIAGS